MARKATGQVLERQTRRGAVFALRFSAYGQRQYVTLGTAADGWTSAGAEEELQNVLADVRRGIWRPPARDDEPAAAETRPVATFHEFASEWIERRRHEGLAPRTIEADEWALSCHLLPHFAGHRLSEITAEEVDRYRSAKVRERERALVKRPLSNRSINATLAALTRVLDVAVDYGHLPANPARRRRLKVAKHPGTFLEPAQVAALLEAAGQLDDEDRAGRRHRRPLLATLAFAGLRIGELLALEWRDVDLAGGRLHVRRSKTDAGVRTVDVQPELHDELAELKARTRAAAGDLVFPTSQGREDNRNNVRRRVLLRAVARANDQIAETGGCDPLPDGLAPHALRRTFASWLVAEGEDPAYVMQQLGHTDPTMTLGLYAKALRSKRRRPHARREAAAIGTSADSTAAALLEAVEA